MNQLKALFLFILLACSLNITAQRIKGSDTVLPVSQETAEIFMKDDPDRRVTVTGGGTGVGISALMDNTTDIAMASRPIKFSEKMKLKAAKQEVVKKSVPQIGQDNKSKVCSSYIIKFKLVIFSSYPLYIL